MLPPRCTACAHARHQLFAEIAAAIGELPPVDRAVFLERWELICERRGWDAAELPSPLLPAPSCVYLSPEEPD